jgi:hypothetical protein
MVKEYKNLLMEIFTKELIKMASLLALDSIFGPTKVFSKVTLKMVWDQVMEFGKKVLDGMINIKVNIQMIKNGDLVFSHGLLEIFIREIIMLM